MKVISLLFGFFLVLGARAQKTIDFSQLFEEFRNQEGLENSTISFLVHDLDSNKEVLSYNASLTMTPASILKIITTATALELLGPEYRFKTTIGYKGVLNNGLLSGDVIILGGGDPTFGSHRFRYHYFKNGGHLFQNCLEKLKELDIVRIEGKVIGDGSYFNVYNTPDTWAWGDIGNYFGATASGLSIFDNACHIHFKSGPNSGDSTQIVAVKPYLPGVTFENSVVSSNIRRDRAYSYGGEYQLKKTISGTIPKNSADFPVRINIPDPPKVAASQLDSLLRNNNMRIDYGPVNINECNNYCPVGDTFVILDEIYSPPLSEIIRMTNLRSVNLYAEHLLCHIGKNYLGRANWKKGVHAITRYWAKRGLELNGFFLADGSGLSRSNGITANHIQYVLNEMYKSENYEVFRASLPVSGKSGTMLHFMKGTAGEGRVLAKTGTLSRVKNYAGYIETENGRKLSFVLMVNNFNGSSFLIKDKVENLLLNFIKY